MWGLFGKYASRHGYGPWANYNCTNPPPLPKVNVGPQGEYNHQWIKPGQKLLDFGGHEDHQLKSGVVTKGPKAKPAKKAIVNEAVVRPNRLKFLETVRAVKNHGMTLQDAMTVTGIGKLGEDSPVWS